MSHKAMVLVCGALLLAVGCSKKEHTMTTDSAAGAMTPSGSDTGKTTAYTAPNANADTVRLSDANIIAKMEGGDSSEVAIATFARTKATNAGVKSYAAMLINDHKKALSDAKALEKKTSINAQTPPNDTTDQATSHVLDRLKSIAKGTAFDTAFVNHEVEDHQHDISDTQSMMGAAQNADVKSALQKSLPVLQKHLNRAQELQGQLGK